MRADDLAKKICEEMNLENPCELILKRLMEGVEPNKVREEARKTFNGTDEEFEEWIKMFKQKYKEWEENE